MDAFRTHYDNLQIKENASDEVIRGAYRYLAQKWHPDKNPDKKEEAERNSKIINDSYAVLSDPQARKEHDEWLAWKRSDENKSSASESENDSQSNSTEENSSQKEEIYSRWDFEKWVGSESWYEDEKFIVIKPDWSTFPPTAKKSETLLRDISGVELLRDWKAVVGDYLSLFGGWLVINAGILTYVDKYNWTDKSSLIFLISTGYIVWKLLAALFKNWILNISTPAGFEYFQTNTALSHNEATIIKDTLIIAISKANGVNKT